MGRRIDKLGRLVRELVQRRSRARLRESEQRYVDLVEQAIDGIIVRRPDGKILLVNDAYCDMGGYTQEEMMGLKVEQLLGKYAGQVLQRTGNVKIGEPLHLETWLQRKDGSYLPIEANTLRLANGNLQSVVRDISERKKAEGLRREIEHRYEQLVEQAADSIWVRDRVGRMLYVNAASCQMLGYSRTQLLESISPDLIHPSDPGTAERIDALEPNATLRIERVMRHREGYPIPVEASVHRLMDGSIQVISHDISERRRVAEQMRAVEHRYETAVNALAEGVALLDAEGRVVAFNKSATRILGMTEDQFTGRMVRDPAWELQYEDGRPFNMAEHPVVITLSTGQDRDNVVLVVGLPDGSRRILMVSSRGLEPDKSGKPTSVLASFRDITVQREHERALQNYAEELRRVSQRILEAQESERRTIARDLHDEVGQSLTATRINLRDLEKDAEGGPLAQRLTDASNIISELLGKVRQMSLDLHPSVLDDLGLGPALHWCVRTRTTGSELQVTLDVPEDLPRFAGTAEITVFRVFQEALSNALRHSAAKHFKVQLRYDGGRLTLRVQDDGHGFDAEAARRTALSGKSLGLLGMQERARLAGGELALESAPGKGALINVSLPADQR